MKILFDNNVPTYLLSGLHGHDITTAFREGWHELANGKLLLAAEQAGFSLLVTLDGGFRHQQNLKGRRISVALLEPVDQSRESMLAVFADLLEKLDDIPEGTILVFSKRK